MSSNRERDLFCVCPFDTLNFTPLFFFSFFCVFFERRGERTSEDTKEKHFKTQRDFDDFKTHLVRRNARLCWTLPREETTTTESSSSSRWTTTVGGGGTGDFSLHFEEKRAKKACFVNARRRRLFFRVVWKRTDLLCRRERFLRATTRGGRHTPTCTEPSSSALFSRRHRERNAKDERATTSIRRSLRTTKRWW